METTTELQKVLAEKGREFATNSDFIRLRDFYEEMKKRGLVIKQDYSLPPLDTAGQRLYQAQQEALHLVEGVVG